MTAFNYQQPPIIQEDEIRDADNGLFKAQTALVQLSKSCWLNGDTVPSGTVDQQWIDETLTQLKEMQQSLMECQSANESIQQTTVAN